MHLIVNENLLQNNGNSYFGADYSLLQGRLLITSEKVIHYFGEDYSSLAADTKQFPTLSTGYFMSSALSQTAMFYIAIERLLTKWLNCSLASNFLLKIDVVIETAIPKGSVLR